MLTYLLRQCSAACISAGLEKVCCWCRALLNTCGESHTMICSCNQRSCLWHCCTQLAQLGRTMADPDKELIRHADKLEVHRHILMQHLAEAGLSKHRQARSRRQHTLP